MPKQIIRWLAPLVLAASTFCGCAQTSPGEKIVIRPRYLPGQYIQTVNVDMNMTMRIGGKAEASKSKQQVVLAYDVAQPNAGGEVVATLVFKRLAQAVSQGEASRSFDSANPGQGDPQLAQALLPLTKARIQVTIAADGKVASITGLDQMWDQLLADNPPLAAEMKKSLGNKMIQSMMGKAAAQYPSQPVAVGQSWTADQELDVPVIGQARISENFLLKSVMDTPAGKVAAIAVTGSFNAAGKEAPLPGGGAAIVKKMAFAMKGNWAADTANILQDAGQMTMDGTMDMEMKSPGRPPQEMSLTMAIAISAKSERAAAPRSTQPSAQLEMN